MIPVTSGSTSDLINRRCKSSYKFCLCEISNFSDVYTAMIYLCSNDTNSPEIYVCKLTYTNKLSQFTIMSNAD